MTNDENRPTARPDTEDVRILADLFRMLGDPTRLAILMACLDAPRPVGAIAAELALSQSLVSHHLRLLRGARLVRGERHGRSISYTADDDHVRDVLTMSLAHIAEAETRDFA